MQKSSFSGITIRIGKLGNHTMTVTILDQHLQMFEKEYKKPHLFTKKKENQYEFSAPPLMNIQVHYLDPGIHMHCMIHAMPTKNLEPFMMEIMEANYLGVGTGKNWLALEPNEKYLTLSMTIPYEVNYMEFKRYIEQYMNYAEYWKDQVEDFIKKQV